MVWVKLDDKFHGHRKTLALFDGPCPGDAIALWTLANSWCGDQLTDGQVPMAFVRRSGLDKRAPDELVRVELWHRTEDGYVFHDWLARNKSREKVETERAEAIERKANGKRRSPDVPSNGRKKFARTDSEPTPVVRATEIPPDPTRSRSEEDLESGGGDLNGQYGADSDPPPPPANGLKPDPEATSATEADARLVAADWRYAAQKAGALGHIYERWKLDFQHVAIALHLAVRGDPELLTYARVGLVAWFWGAPGGPIQGGRLDRERVDPAALSKNVTRDLANAKAWWEQLDDDGREELLDEFARARSARPAAEARA